MTDHTNVYGAVGIRCWLFALDRFELDQCIQASHFSVVCEWVPNEYDRGRNWNAVLQYDE